MAADTPVETEEMYRTVLHTAHLIANSVRHLPLGSMLEAIALAESHAPVTHPTLMQKMGPLMAQDKQVLTILKECQDKLAAQLAAVNRA